MIFQTKEQIEASVHNEDKLALIAMNCEDIYTELLVCSFQGYLSKVAYILINDELVEKLNRYNKDYINHCFKKASTSSNIEVLRFLLTSAFIEYKPDIHYKNDDALKWACENSHIRLVKYLLTSPELGEHSNPYIDSCEAFQIAANSNYMDIVYYFIDDYNLIYNDDIKAYLQTDDARSKEVIIKKFESRDLSRSLDNTLQQKNNDKLDNIVVNKV